MKYVLTDKRPWGKFEKFTQNEKTTVKLLYIKKGRRLSYQFHNHRSEFWKVVVGKIRVVLNKRKIILSEGRSIKIPIKALHRIEGLEDAVVLEIAYGKFDENDIVRVEDDYHRVAN